MASDVNEILQTPPSSGEAPVAKENAPVCDVKSEKPKRRIPNGRLITKETAKAYQVSSARAKRLRKEARMKMLAALTTNLDLGEELLKAMRKHDESYLSMIEKATRLTGLQWDQSDEGREQRLHVNSKSEVDHSGKVETSLKFIIEDAKPEA